MAELLINGKDALATWGIALGEGSLNALLAPSELKAFVENESRLEHGKSVYVDSPMLSSREVTLTFLMKASSAALLRRRRTSFYAMLYAGKVTIQVPDVAGYVFNLVYSKSSSYAFSRSRCFCKIAVKFIEPNPNNRS